MKKNLIKIAALGFVAASAFSCAKEEIVVDKPTMATCEFSACTDTVSKTHIGGISGSTANIVWDEDDNISVFATNGTSHINNKFTISNISGGSAKFTGEIEDKTTNLVAIYPYSSSLSYSDGVISNAVIPTTQEATANSFAVGSSLAIASGTRTPGVPSSTSALSFENLCSSLSFVLPGNINASKIKVTAKSGAGIAGDVSVNCSTPAISGAATSAIELSGTFVGGNTYYVTIAPGTYEGGFRLDVTTTSGNSYTLETTKDLTAVAGKIHHLGYLTLKLANADFTTSVALAHNISSGTLNGTDAKFSLSVNKAEFASIISEYKYTVTIMDANDNVYRQSSGTSASAPSSVTIAVVNSRPYMPKGSYSYTVSLDYKVSNGTSNVTRHVDLSGSATSPQVSGFAVDANLSGYTSYSTYAGTDGQTASASDANNLDGSTIYGIGASYKSGMSSAVYSQCSGMLSFTSYLDGSAASGNQSGKSWAAHSISASWSFDGAGGNCATTKTVHVTGLPYNKNNDKAYNYKDDWSWTKNGSWKDESYLNWYLATVNFKGFYIPANINSTISYRFKNYSGSSFWTYLKCWAGGTLFVNAEDRATSKWYEYSGTNSTITFTPSNNTVKCENSAKSSMASSLVATSQMFYFGAVYR